MKLPLNIIRFPAAALVKPLDLVPAPAIEPVNPGVLAAAESKASAAATSPSGFQTPQYLTEADLALLPPLKRTALGMKALTALERFIPPSQWQATRDLIRSSEEKDFFIHCMLKIEALVAAMPHTYQSQDERDPFVWLHYFGGGYDSWIIEKDKGDKDDPVKGVQHQAYGYVRWQHMPECAEVGYVSLPEAFQHIRILQLDYHFTPCRLSEIKARLDGADQDEEAVA
jgi:hypothetical protein